MNYDGGKYFLTVLAPIRRDLVDGGDGVRRSPTRLLRQTLATLPVARQDHPSVASGLESPFARVPRTHFVRFFILDELRYNGRRKSNAIMDLLANANLLKTEKIDHLIDPYLVFTVDFDAESGSDSQLRSYVDGLWAQAGDELKMIFAHCEGFDQVSDADGFFRYIKRCQVETTMPFTDYWTGPLPEWHLPRKLAIGAGAVLAAALALWLGDAWRGSGLGLVLTTLLALLAVTIVLVVREGLQIWPAAPHSDLRSLLKAIYLQQNFVAFATQQQGASDQELYDAYGAFCGTHKPRDIDGPTQPAGTLVTNGWRNDTRT